MRNGNRTRAHGAAALPRAQGTAGRGVCAGIDAGSRLIKVVFVAADRGTVVAAGMAPQGPQPERRIRDLFARLLVESDLTHREVGRVVATGYARHRTDLADVAITEITCHACGVHSLVPAARTVVEIGGQDSKVLWLEADGSVRDFAMNERCAAGTGRFLEAVADRLGIDMAALGELAAASLHPAEISSTCVVFAETEITGLLAGDTPPADIVAGVEASVASRVAAMASRRAQTPVVFTGGVALLPGMRTALAAALGVPVAVVPQPQYTGALGAARLAWQDMVGSHPMAGAPATGHSLSGGEPCARGGRAGCGADQTRRH